MVMTALTVAFLLWPPLCPALPFFLYREKPPVPAWYLQWAGLAAFNAGMALALGYWWPAAASALSGVVALLLWWRSRRKGRKRAGKLIGAKSRALREKLVKTMPRWEPRMPQGATA